MFELDTIVCGDCLEIAPTLPDSSIDLLINDPPYYKVKNEWWDHQWDTADGYMEWFDKVCQQWYRLLKPNGSLYVFASPKMAARVEVKVSEYFNVLNRIRWLKEEGWHKKAVPEALCSFLSPWEEIIFAEHYGADNAAKGESGYGAKCDELRGFVFEPLRAYLDGERRRAGLNYRACNKAIGKPVAGGGMATHYFSDPETLNHPQWALPTFEHYCALQKSFNEQGRQAAPSYEDYHDAPRSRFERDHSDHEYLRAEHEDLRRPFTVTAQDQYTDVWEFPTVKHYLGKHPCEKPQAMVKHMIQVSSKQGAVMADFFCGSGVTAEIAQKLKRHFYACDIDQKYVTAANKRLEKAQLEVVQVKMDLTK